MFSRVFCFLLCFLILLSCQPGRDKSKGNISNDSVADSVYYATGFIMETHPEYHLVQLKNPWKTGQILQTYILCPKSEELPADLPEGILLRTPLDNTVSFSAVTCGYLEELGVLNTLIGVAEPQYINIPFIQEGIEKRKIADIGQAANPNIEKLILIEPEVIFTNPISDSGVNSLNRIDVPVVNCFEYMETNPLGQAEWIRFLGLLFDRKEKADSIFFQTVKSYNELKDIVSKISSQPTVFTELKYGDFWHMPGGESYMAQLLSDAGAAYILKDNDSSGSVSLNFEMVLDKAENADFWLFKYYAPYEMTYKQLASENANYTLFKAYKNQNVYGCNTRMITNYYREIPLHPDWLLKDLIWVFHPNLLPDDFRPRYYSKIENK
ncbi:MAG: ABC transporter substrate-binding protein [Bacteroidales bacterium]|nr:ABC transporter substrate-binding protein [Bacteroidales bacterium]